MARVENFVLKNALTIASFPSNALAAPGLRFVEDARSYTGRDMMKGVLPTLIFTEYLGSRILARLLMCDALFLTRYSIGV